MKSEQDEVGALTWDVGQLVEQLHKDKLNIRCGHIGSRRYKTLEGVMQSIKDHPFGKKSRAIDNLADAHIIPLAKLEDKHLFGILYENSKPGFVRNSADILINLEDRLFSEKEFTPDNSRFVLLDHSQYTTLSDMINGVEPKKPATNIIPTVPLAELDTIHKLFYSIVTKAIEQRAADIHFERLAEDETRVRFRIDGKMVVFDDAIPPDVFKRLISAVKTIAEVKSYDPFEAQDGSITFNKQAVQRYKALGGHSLRLSTVPMTYDAGCKVVDRLVLRIHESEKSRQNLEELGFPKAMVEQIYDIVSAAQGLMLVTGPTGSGKTTTLYSILQHLNTTERNIMTIEEPIESFIKGLNQSQVNKERGWTFDRVMRHYLRQNPDVILVGEVRDPETADILFRAAETGHFVFSTVHTNSAFDTLHRVYSLGIKPTYVMSSLNAVLSQRLVRLICTDCREEYDAAEQINRYLRESAVETPFNLYRPTKNRNCRLCLGTGYYGRTAVPELWVIDEKAQDIIATGTAVPSLYRDAAMEQGTKTLMQNGVNLVLEGKTSLQEITRFARSGFYNERKYIEPIFREYQKNVSR